MAPVQAVLLPINDELAAHARELRQQLEAAGIRTEVDERTESLNKKIREAQLNRVPLILTVGAREKAAGTFAVRTLDGQVHHGLSRESFFEKVRDHIRKRRLDLELFGPPPVPQP
jgi:threonyl-tRNA synthetase